MPYRLERTQVVPVSLAECWEFFSHPRNLDRITPPDMDFLIVGDPPDRNVEGLEVSYRVSPLWGIHLHWTSRITVCEPPNRFVDEQIRGPYRLWRHDHILRQVEGGVEMVDIVDYEMPLPWLTWWLHGIVVRPRLEEIFDYRREAVIEIFGAPPA